MPSNGRTKTSGAQGGGVFEPDVAGEPQRAANISASSTANGIGALLAMQAVEDAVYGRRKAVKRANLLLDTLEEMRLDLLAGRVSEGRLNRAIALLQQAKSHSEPGLDEVVADIELRVRVELAKLGKYPSF